MLKTSQTDDELLHNPNVTGAPGRYVVWNVTLPSRSPGNYKRSRFPPKTKPSLKVRVDISMPPRCNGIAKVDTALLGERTVYTSHSISLDTMGKEWCFGVMIEWRLIDALVL